MERNPGSASGLWLRRDEDAFSEAAMKHAFLVLAAELGLYLFVALACSIQIAWGTHGGIGMFLLIPIAFLTIHISWGASFLMALLRGTGK